MGRDNRVEDVGRGRKESYKRRKCCMRRKRWRWRRQRLRRRRGTERREGSAVEGKEREVR